MRAILFLVVAFLGIGCWGTAISPMEIAEARQHCTVQCSNPNHKEAAACMRQCWATFFAQRKAQGVRHAPSPPIKARSVAPAAKAAAPVSYRKARSPVMKAHPKLVKANHRQSNKKHVAPFSHPRHSSGIKHVLASLSALILIVLLIQ